MKIQGRQNQTYQPSSGQKTVGIVAGFCVASAPVVPSILNLGKPISEANLEKRKQFFKKYIIEIASFTEIKQYADKILKGNQFKNSRLKIHIVNPENVDKLRPLPRARKTFIQKIKYMNRANKNKILANGLNACFSPKLNAVFINDKHLYSVVFHEMGHALNYNSPSGRFTQKLGVKGSKAMPFVALGCLMTGLFSSKKSVNENKKEANGQKIASFIRNNAGKIVFLTYLPIIAEEASASLKGFKLAKKYLTAAQHKIHIRNQIIALSTYIVGGLIPALMVSCGIKVKDKIAQPNK